MQQPQYVHYPPGHPQAQPAVVQQPTIVQPNMATTTNINIGLGKGALKERDWATGKCGCMSDFESCCLAMLCWQPYLCFVSHLLGESCLMPICVPEALMALRIKLRTKENIKGSIIKDCCASYWCGPCVLCQLKREHDVVKKTSGAT